MHTIITFYMEDNGKLLVVDETHMNLFSFLTKLGIKSVPTKRLQSIMTTNVPPGTYTVTYNHNQQATFTVREPKIEQLNVKIALKEPKKLRNKPDRDKRRQWREASKRHGKNTGRFR